MTDGGAKMRIAEICTDFLPGGIQRHVLDLTRDLRAQGHDVVLLGDSGDWFPPDGVHLPLSRVAGYSGKMISRIGAILPAVLTLRRELRTRQVQLIHAHETAPALIARIASVGLGIPIVMTFHGSAPARERQVANMARRCADVVVSPSKDGIDRLVAAGLPRANCRVIGLGISAMPQIESAEVAAVRARLLDGKAGPLIFSLSRIALQKGIDVMVEVAKQVVRQRPETVFVIAGGGPLSQDAAKWIRDAGLLDNMRLLGPVSPVAPYLAAADIFLLTSRWENLPVSIVEAFRAGLPVVATDCGGVRELVDDPVGALVPVEQPEATATALLELIGDEATRARKGQAALQRSQETRFTPLDVHARFEALYRDLIAGENALR